ncbi:protein FAM98A-like [Lycorma delicatula]|uniref:protein FAM98A-like n=1 Tax=Lycorma delicatula TaxID=130591 RepID=UPI003F5123E6
MENDILDGLKAINYEELDQSNFENAINEGPKSISYTQLIEWISKELKVLCSLEEHVNQITAPEDSSSFLLELSSFLKELGCHYSCLTEGNVNERLHSRYNRLLLLDFLILELQAARMMVVVKPNIKNHMEVTLKESSTAADLKNMLIALKFPKPPDNIPPAVLFGKVQSKVKQVLSTSPPELVGKPLLNTILTEKQWYALEDVLEKLRNEYKLRREMLLKRLDVTIQSFQWSDRLKKQEDRIAQVYTAQRKNILTEPNVDIADLLAAREDLAIVEKTSGASVRKKTQSSTNKVIIGRVPDRGGRPNEQEPPPPEMPSWQQRGAGGGGGGFSGGRGGGGGGGDRGGRVQGGWNQGGGRGGGGGYQDNRGGGYQDNRSTGYQDARGGGYQDNRMGGYQGGYQDNRGGYHDNRGGGYHDSRGGYGGYQGGGGGGGGGSYHQGGGGYHQGGGAGYHGGGGGYQDNRGYDNRGGYQGGRGRDRDRRGQNYR